MSSRWRTALVTGASGGIGEALARRVAARGTDLVVVARREERLQLLAGELERTHGVGCEVMVADLSRDADVERVAARVADADRPVDLLVGNAGFATTGTFRELDVARELDEVEVLVGAVQRLSQTAATAMTGRGRGGILNVASGVAYQPTPGSATYSACKAWVLSYTQALHLELLGTGVHATVLSPGFTRTDFQAEAGVDAELIPRWLWQDADDVARVGLQAVTRNTPLAVPGIANRLHSSTIRLAPRGMVRRTARLVSRRWGM